MCGGMNLAMAEVYLTLATVFRRFSLELIDCIRERDIEVTRDFVSTATGPKSKGTIVKVIG